MCRIVFVDFVDREVSAINFDVVGAFRQLNSIFTAIDTQNRLVVVRVNIEGRAVLVDNDSVNFVAVVRNFDFCVCIESENFSNFAVLVDNEGNARVAVSGVSIVIAGDCEDLVAEGVRHSRAGKVSRHNRGIRCTDYGNVSVSRNNISYRERLILVNFHSVAVNFRTFAGNNNRRVGNLETAFDKSNSRFACRSYTLAVNGNRAGHYERIAVFNIGNNQAAVGRFNSERTVRVDKAFDSIRAVGNGSIGVICREGDLCIVEVDRAENFFRAFSVERVGVIRRLRQRAVNNCRIFCVVDNREGRAAFAGNHCSFFNRDSSGVAVVYFNNCSPVFIVAEFRKEHAAIFFNSGTNPHCAFLNQSSGRLRVGGFTAVDFDREEFALIESVDSQDISIDADKRIVDSRNCVIACSHVNAATDKERAGFKVNAGDVCDNSERIVCVDSERAGHSVNREHSSAAFANRSNRRVREVLSNRRGNAGDTDSFNERSLSGSSVCGELVNFCFAIVIQSTELSRRSVNIVNNNRANKCLGVFRRNCKGVAIDKSNHIAPVIVARKFFESNCVRAGFFHSNIAGVE